MDDIGQQLLIIFALLILNGVFAMTEMAIVSARKVRLEQLSQEGSLGAQLALDLSKDPTQMLSTIQIGITLISIITGLYGGATLSEPLAQGIKLHLPKFSHYADTMSPFIIVTLVTYFSLVIGELVPKRIALTNPENYAVLMARPIHIFSKISTPLVSFLSMSTSLLLRILGIEAKEHAPITEEEIKVMIHQGAAMGVFEKDEPELVDNIFRLSDTNVADVMTPRTQLTWIDSQKTEEEIRTLIIESPHYRLPVGKDSLDEFEGMINTSDIFAKLLASQKNPSLKDLIHSLLWKPMMVAETIPLTKLLNLFKEESVHEALVLDEFGAISGFVTIHDIMEEIVGYIPSTEEDRLEEENRIQKRGPNSWYIDGLMDADEFREYFHIESYLPGEEEDLFKTMGGFVTYQIGRIPKEGNSFHWEHFTFEVCDMDNTRVDKIMLTFHPSMDTNTSLPDTH